MATESKTLKPAAPKAALPAKTAVSNLTLGSADDALTLATELQKFVKANGLTSTIQGKQFPQVEAWQFAGSLLGLSPMLESIEDRSSADEIKWQAMVSITNTRTGATVGRGFATCSNKEQAKRSFADYAICSMAQTRAVGKAYRLSLGWLMKAAGYEATPLEEMSDVGTGATVEPKKLTAGGDAPASPPPAVSAGAAASGDGLADVRKKLAETRSKLDLRDLFNTLAVGDQAALKEEFTAARVRIEAAIAAAASAPLAVVPPAAQAVPSITTPANRPEADEQGNPIEYATGEQRQEILRLLNHPNVTRQQKTNTILRINKYTASKAVEMIAQLGQIADTGGEGHAQLVSGFNSWIREMSQAQHISLKEAERLLGVAEKQSTADIRSEWMAAREALGAPVELAEREEVARA